MDHKICYATLKYDEPWTLENYLQEGGYDAWKKILDERMPPEEVVEENLIWTTGPDGKKDQLGSLMEIGMTEEYGAQVYGKMPPDLTLTARSRGPARDHNCAVRPAEPGQHAPNRAGPRAGPAAC